MALRDNPYLPLYVQDFLTDEKLAECSAESTGVYIRLLCLMHKSEVYGTIVLKQKDKQKAEICYNKIPNNIETFANKLVKQLPYIEDVILHSLHELIEEGVLTLDGDTLYQKRMVKDCAISEKRSKSGKKGMGSRYEPKKVVKDFVITNELTNSDNENDIDNDSVSDNKKGGAGGIRGLQERIQVFYDDLRPYVEKFGKKTVRDFFEYWSEPTQNGSKFRKEMERTWSTERRLNIWKRNEAKYETPATTNRQSNARPTDNERREGYAAALNEIINGTDSADIPIL